MVTRAEDTASSPQPAASFSAALARIILCESDACAPSSECVNFLYRMVYLHVFAHARGPAARARVRAVAARVTAKACAMRLILKGALQGHGPALSIVHSPSHQEHHTHPRKTHACACALPHRRTHTSTRTMNCLSKLQQQACNWPRKRPWQRHRNGAGQRAGTPAHCTCESHEALAPKSRPRLSFRLLRTPTCLAAQRGVMESGFEF